MKILFICKHNRFRSKVAEAIFNKLNKKSKNKSYSGGVILDKLRLRIAKNVVKVMKEKEYNIKGKSKQINKNRINNYDLIIIVANNVSKKEFKGFKGEIIQWRISDASELDYKKIKEIVNKIEIKVKKLIKGL